MPGLSVRQVSSFLILAGLLLWPGQRALPSPPPPSDRLDEARTALARGDYSQARSVLEHLLTQEPENAGALILLGKTLVESDRHGEAAGPLENALKWVPDSGEALFWIWRAKQKTGPPEESDPYFFRALKGTATDPVLYELAEEAYGRGLYQEAIQALRRIQDPDRLDQPHATLLAACLHARGDVQGALGVLDEAVARDSSGQTHFSLGYYLLQAGRIEEAAKHLRRSLDLVPTSANSRFYLAKIRESEGDLGKAEEIYREIVDLRPNHSHAHAALGRLALKDGRFQEAEELLKHSIRLDPDYRQAHYTLGLLYNRTGETEKARVELQKSEELRQAEARPADSLLIRDTGSDEMRRLDSDNPVFQKFRLGVEAHKQGDHAEAEAAYLEVVRVAPGFAEAQMNLGLLLHDGNRLEAAIERLRTAIRLDPRLPTAHYFLGMDLYLTSQFEGALSSLRKARELAPGTPLLSYWLGLTLLALGRYQEAAKELESHLHQAPKDTPDANRALLLAYAQLPDPDALWRRAQLLAGMRGGKSRAHQIAARAYLDAGRRKDAVIHLKEVVRLERSSGAAMQALSALVDAYGQLGMSREAEAAREALTAMQSRNGK